MKKAITILILTCLIATTVGVGLGYPRPAKAFLFLDSGGIFWPIKIGIDVTNRIANLIDKALGKAGAIAYKNALKYFLGKIAEDTAVWVASGGKGGEPLFHNKSFGGYLRDVADEAAGEFMYDLFSTRPQGHCEKTKSKKCSRDSDCPTYYKPPPKELADKLYANRQFDLLNKISHPHETCILPPTAVDVCEPKSLFARLEIRYGLTRAYPGRVTKPQCTFSEIRENWQKAVKDPNFLRNFSVAFVPEETDLGAYLKLRTALNTQIEKKVEEATKEREEGKGFKALTTRIADYIKTPALMISKQAQTTIEASSKAEETYTGQIWADAITTFTGTLANKLMDKWLKKGMWSLANLKQSGSGGFLSSGGDFFLLETAQQAARELYGVLGQPQYNFDVGIRLTDELTIQGEGQFNNVIDDRFSKAIEDECTLGQAIGYYQPGDDAYRPECAGLISGTAYFGYDQDGHEVSLSYGLPYRSILVLRKFRIVPVGWELAAKYYQKFDDKTERLTLNRLVKEYNDPESPYYKLVDPDWLLKAPATRCVREGAGPQKIEQEPYCAGTLLDDGTCDGEVVYPFQRLNYCADYQTCLKEKPNGTCDTNDWGYCLEEKPVWQIDGTECPKKYYATCQTLTRLDNNQVVHYLLNTLSDSGCDSSNAGCREYCTQLEFSANQGDWVWGCSFNDAQDTEFTDGRKVNRIFLDSDSPDCSNADEGCHLLYSSYDKDSEEVRTALEAGTRADDPDPNAYGLLKKNYVKLAPSYYDCQGYTRPVPGISARDACITAGHFWRDDLKICVQSGSEQCAYFTKHCKGDTAAGEPEDVNVACKLYTPVSTKDPAVPAVISVRICPNDNPDCADETDSNIVWNDQCPASCVGYKTYHQTETSFERATGDLGNPDPSFIASTAKTCSEPGCDQFTNLDEVAKGGEGIEYYSYLRQCVKPEQGGWTTYYTWEGSDTTGYQLKKWELVEGPDSGPEIVDGDYDDCQLTDQDCREFFDQDLNSYKRYYSKTVVVSDDCHPFRRTRVSDDAARERNDCLATRGAWDSDNEYCIYQAVPGESRRCSANNNMCREYKSNQGYNYQKIIESYFKDPDDFEGWGEANIDVKISAESVRRGDYSLELRSSAKTEHNLVQGDLEEGKIYTLEFLAKGSGVLTAEFIGDGQVIISNTINLIDENNWLHYILKLPDQAIGGLTKDQVDSNDNKIRISTNSTQSVYLDNIILKKMQSILLIKNSWETPAECENDSPLPNGIRATMLGCESYQDSDNNNINLRNFSRLCFEDVVGCELVIDSKNTANDKSDDVLDYLVLNPSFSCSEKNKGCTRLGLITPKRDNDEEYIFSDEYKVVDPDKEFEQLCQPNEVFCQGYQDEDGSVYYFKDPLDRTCEFKQIDPDIGYKWYKSGSDVECNGADEYTPLPTTPNPTYIYTKHCIGGKSLLPNNSCNDNSDCTNLASPDVPGLCADWVGVCEAGSSGCREYQDPQEPEGCNKSYRNYEPGASEGEICNYYYYKDVKECGSVNPSQGCVGFNQTDNPEKTIRSYKICINSKGETLDQVCEEDADCPDGYRCVYTNVE